MAQRSVDRRLENPAHRPHWVPVTQINRDLLYAFVMSEDSNFFEHEGIDMDAMVVSFAENYRSGQYDYGASTISQQVVKNVFLSQHKSIIRKLKEILLTKRLEARFSKNEILEIYLNVAELGPDIYGVGAASHAVFGKPASKINAAEGAFMAQLLPSPRRNFYSMVQNHNLPPQKRRKIRRILSDMLSEEFISPDQYRHYTKYNYFRGMK